MPRRPLIIALAAVGVIVIGTVVFFVVRSNKVAGPECHVRGHSGAADLDLDAVQLQHASTINAVGLSRGLPQRAMVIALATAFQESSMRNLPNGDRDSLGLFQQRPSQGWGTKAQIIDPVYAAGKFYDALVEVPNWQTVPLTEAAQAVQYSGFPDAYAKWEGQAKTLAVALGGTVPPDLSCRAGAGPSTAAPPSRDPLSGAADASDPLTAVLAAANAELGGLTVREISDNGATAVLGAALPDRSAEAAGRALAAWAVAHATSFSVTAVEVDGRRYAGNAWHDDAATARPAGQVAIAVG
ncbi:hypothetical protein [Nakamurella lactea]|uniref:hypothetical protein n=1 Tax=Nakamurella lactea TaxID=459515 RepID=UPI0012B673C6|nr:hypothetical protein [Nakamurella lactea]